MLTSQLTNTTYLYANQINTIKLNTTRGGLAKMGHRTELAHSLAPVLHSNQESTVICPTCSSTVTTIITTPYGKVCSGCYKLIYIKPKNTQPLSKVS